MRTRTITPEDLIEALNPYTDGGELERMSDKISAIHQLFEALLRTLTPAQLLAVYEARFATRMQYGGTVELTAPEVAR